DEQQRQDNDVSSREHPALPRRERQIFQQLRDVESGVADHGRDDAAPREVEESPDQSEDARGNHRVVTLLDVSEAEEYAAVDDDANRFAAEVLTKPVHDEPPLHFLADA